MYELYELRQWWLVVSFGGKGKVFGTLIGALIIGSHSNGMNLTGVQSYTQKVVL